MAANTVQTEAASESKAGETTRGTPYLTPRVHFSETDNDLTLHAAVPGVSAGDVDLPFERGELILQGRISRHEHVGQPLLAEYQEGDFYRVFQIHESIDSTRIEAECKHGVL